jgi:hypothetical protein
MSKFDEIIDQAWIAHWEAVIASEKSRKEEDNYGEDNIQEMYETMMEED